jgi:hypothetical protein
MMGVMGVMRMVLVLVLRCAVLCCVVMVMLKILQISSTFNQT